MFKVGLLPIKFCRMKNVLTQRIMTTMNPIHFEIEDESRFHSRGKETHFKMLIVSDKFENISKLNKQRLVYENLGDLMPQIHALTLSCYTPK